MKVSVCLCTYNGSRYIVQQLQSILSQLTKDDEVLIFDDKSSDGTVSLIESLSDDRINLYVNEINYGYVKNFEQAIIAATGDVIMLADQDDIWPVGRANLMIKELLDSQKEVVVGNFSEFFDAKGQLSLQSPANKVSLRANKRNLKKIISVLLGIGTPYFGCCMAFKKDFISKIIPFPSVVESHDIWIALNGNYYNQILHIENIVLYRRLHDNNLTKDNRSTYFKIRSRIKRLISIIIIYLRKI